MQTDPRAYYDQVVQKVSEKARVRPCIGKGYDDVQIDAPAMSQ